MFDVMHGTRTADPNDVPDWLAPYLEGAQVIVRGWTEAHLKVHGHILFSNPQCVSAVLNGALAELIRSPDFPETLKAHAAACYLVSGNVAYDALERHQRGLQTVRDLGTLMDAVREADVMDRAAQSGAGVRYGTRLFDGPTSDADANAFPTGRKGDKPGKS